MTNIVDTKGYLDGLPPEIQVLILLQIATIQDLRSLIYASAQYYGAFKVTREKVMSAVLHRTVLPSALSNALSTVKIIACHKSRNRDKEQVLDFINTFKEDRTTDDTTKTIPLSLSLPLCQLHRSVEYFVHDCSKLWLPLLHARSLAMKPNLDSTTVDNLEIAPLSLSEEARLQRALYNFEFYCQIFHSTELSIEDPLFKAIDQSHIFLAELPPWQVEELACICDYFHCRLRDIFDRVEDDFVKLVIADGFENVSPPDSYDIFYDKPSRSSVASDDGFDNYDNPDRFSDTDSFFAGTNKSLQEEYIEYIMSFGLPFLNQLLEAGSRERSKLVLENAVSHVEFLSRALKEVPSENSEIYKQEESAFLCGIRLDFSNDSPEGRNEAWLWAHDFRPWPGYNDGEQEHLRRWGYVFWDSARLRDGILNQPTFDVYLREPPTTHRWQEPSAEERVKRMKPLLSSDPYKLERKTTNSSWARARVDSTSQDSTSQSVTTHDVKGQESMSQESDTIGQDGTSQGPTDKDQSSQDMTGEDLMNRDLAGRGSGLLIEV